MYIIPVYGSSFGSSWHCKASGKLHNFATLSGRIDVEDAISALAALTEHGELRNLGL